MNRFSYEWDKFSTLFKFYDRNYLSYYCKVSSEKKAIELANQLIKELKNFELENKNGTIKSK